MILSMLSSAVLIGVTGLAIDYGNAVMLEAQLQSATDIATLAGVQEIPYDLSAEEKMDQFIQQNYKYSSDVVAVLNSDDAGCWMTASHDVPTYFMRFFGQETLTIHANARAVLQPVEGTSGGPGVMPFVMINPNKNGNPADDLNEGNHGKPYVLKYGPDNIMVEDWYAGRQNVGSEVEHYEGNLPDGGWRSSLGLDPGSEDPEDQSNSANDFRTNFGEGWSGTVEIGDMLGSNPGVMTSGTVQGRRQRLNGYETYNWNGFDPNLDPTNNRIVVVPIVSIGQYDSMGIWQEATSSDIESGNYDWKSSRVDGFAAFFLLTDDEQDILPGGEDIDSKWIVGRFMYGVNIGGDIKNPGGSLGPDLGMFQGRLVPFESN